MRTTSYARWVRLSVGAGACCAILVARAAGSAPPVAAAATAVFGHPVHHQQQPERELLADGERRLHQHAGRQLDLHLELRPQRRRFPVPRAGAVRQPGRHGDGGAEQHACRKPPRSCSWASTTSRPTAPRPSRSSAAATPDLADQQRRGDRRQRHLQLRGQQPGHLPVRERHGRRQAGADGPVRRAGRAPGRPPRLGLQQRRPGLRPVRPDHRVRHAALRDRPEPALGGRAGAALRRDHPAPALLADQRALLPGHHRAEQRRLAAQPALQLAVPHQGD